MRSVALLLALCAAAAAARESVLEDEWRRFKTEHSRRYASSAEEAERRDIFALNLQSIAAHNAKNLSWTLGVTQFTDLTREEFVERTGLLRQARSFSAELPLAAHRPDGGALPASVDWRAKGAVAPVKDQGRCEGCWAFAATGAMEGLTKIANGELQSLSEEQLRTCSSSLPLRLEGSSKQLPACTVDCSSVDGNLGCGGGNAVNAFRWVDQNHGICTEAGYNFTAGGGATGKCQTGCKKVLSIKGASGVAKNNETALMAAISINPVAVAIEADALQNYKSGVFSASCGDNIDVRSPSHPLPTCVSSSLTPKPSCRSTTSSRSATTRPAPPRTS